VWQIFLKHNNGVFELEFLSIGQTQHHDARVYQSADKYKFAILKKVLEMTA
jgi:hypothetical protein